MSKMQPPMWFEHGSVINRPRRNPLVVPDDVRARVEQIVAGRAGWSGPIGMTMTSTPPEPPAPPTPPTPTPPAPTPPTPPTPPAPSGEPKEAVDDQGRSLGFPADTPVEKMSDGQAAAYWRNQSRVQEKRSKAWADTFTGKKPEDVKAALDELAAKTLTEQEQAIEKARQEGIEQGKQAGVTTSAVDTATLLLESYLENRIEDEGRRKTLLTTVDVRTAVGEDGKVDPVRVRAIADALAPQVDGRSGGNKQRVIDIGGGRRQSSTGSGVARGRELFEERHGKKAAAGGDA